MSLDPIARRELWKIIKDKINTNNSSIVLTSHHMDEAQTLSD